MLQPRDTHVLPTGSGLVRRSLWPAHDRSPLSPMNVGFVLQRRDTHVLPTGSGLVRRSVWPAHDRSPPSPMNLGVVLQPRDTHVLPTGSGLISEPWWPAHDRSPLSPMNVGVVLQPRDTHVLPTGSGLVRSLMWVTHENFPPSPLKQAITMHSVLMHLRAYTFTQMPGQCCEHLVGVSPILAAKQGRVLQPGWMHARGCDGRASKSARHHSSGRSGAPASNTYMPSTMAGFT